MKVFRAAKGYLNFPQRENLLVGVTRVLKNLEFDRKFSNMSEDSELKDFLDYLNNLKNFEKLGVPKDAGTDSEDGFDLGRMTRLMNLLGNPQSKYKSVHIAGTKGKGSTAAFLSNILRAAGFSVGCYTSPHIHTIRERISLEKSGEPVSAKTLNYFFQRKKLILDQAVELEYGHLSHFEVLTAVAFSLFAEANVDIAIIEAGLGGARDATNIIPSSSLATSIITSIGEEHLAALGGSLESIAKAKSGIIKTGRPVVLGGPYLSHIEKILHDKATLLNSPVISAYDPGNRSTIKCISNISGNLRQSCDIKLDIKNLKSSIELLDVNLNMLGSHQLQNAATATCAALSLRDQGWRISDESIRSGLELTNLPGRSQILSSKETEALGLAGTTVLFDGAHTKDSAKALADTIHMAFPNTRVVFIIAMAADKDHFGFAQQLISVKHLEAVFLTEISIAGSKFRTSSSSLLKDCWIKASKQAELDILEYQTEEYLDILKNQTLPISEATENKILLFADTPPLASVRAAHQILQSKSKNQPGIIVITGSLHIISSVLDSIQK